MLPSSPILEAVNLGRRHPDGRRWLLEEVSMAVRAGEPVGLLGQSGSGKTLLLRALAMLDPTDAGEVRFQGQTPRRTEVPAYRRRVIYLHQRAILPGKTVEESLRIPYAFKIHGDRCFDKDRVAGWLHEVGRDESFLEKSTSNLSGGEQQLAALIRAMQLEPAVLLLDEPTASLDRRAMQTVETLLQRWLDESPESRSYVWVGHDAEQAERMTRRIVHIDGGRLVEKARL